MTPFHVELDRRFRRVPVDVDVEQAAVDSYALELFGDSSGLSWDDLLTESRVVILGEPGSGKTHELRQKADSLQGAGNVAIFVPLERLVSESLADTLGPDDLQRLRRWLRSSSRAFFFLDSVDESKRRCHRDFLTALERFRDGVLTGLDRATVVVSSRIAEWQPSSDRHEIESRLPATRKPEDKDGPVGPVVVQIEPLDRDRVKRLVSTQGDVRADEFLGALDATHAWTFARRPLDVQALLEYWNANRSLGTLRQLIEFDTEHRLRETHERSRQDPLSPGQAWQGAIALAAATVFCRRLDFRVPDDAMGQPVDALDAAGCLPSDWPPELQRALLDRALFDGASFGRIRFHHRRVSEYLAAQWLEERMVQGCPIDTLDELLFDRRAAPPVMRPALAPVAAWLAWGDHPWNQMVRAGALDADPRLFFMFGDPASLPLDFRREMLRRLSKRYAARDRAWIDAEPEALARIADPGLGDTIRELVADRGAPTDLRELYLLLIRYGRLTDCLDVALDVVADPQESERLRRYAAGAIRDAGDAEFKRRLALTAARFSTISSSLCAVVCEALYPAAIGSNALLELLAKVESVPRAVSGDLPWRLAQLFDTALRSEDLITVLRGLLGLARTPPNIHINKEESPISRRYYWAGDVALDVVGQALVRGQFDTETTEVLTEALALLWPHRRLLGDGLADWKKVAEGLIRHHEVRRSYTWRRVVDLRAATPTAEVSSEDVCGSDCPFQLGESDLEWLCRDIQSPQEPADPHVAFSLAVEVWASLGRPSRWRRGIARAVRRDANLRLLARSRLRPSLSFHLQRFWYRHLRDGIASKWWWRRRRSALQQDATQLRERWSLLRNLRRLATGERVEWLAHLAIVATIRDRWTFEAWDQLAKARGKWIARAARKGCKRAWRHFEPLLPHEKPEPGRTDRRISVGLSGIAATLADGELSPPKMSSQEAVLATRYAVNELNEFPSWLYDLAQHHPAAVGGVLTECLRGEWALAPQKEPFHGVVTRLQWHGDRLLPLVEKPLFAVLERTDPERPEMLGEVLSLASRFGSTHLGLLGDLAAQRAPGYDPSDYRQTLWTSVWLQTDALPAIGYLRTRLQTIDKAAEVVIGLCVSLQGGRDGNPLLAANPSYLAPASMRQFIQLVYSYLKPAEDLVRQAGCSYSPTSRDDAQDMRDRLLTQLANSDEPDAEATLLDLMKEPVLSPGRDLILHLIEQRRVRRADLPAWEPHDIRVFAQDHETDPKNDQDLFKMAKRRLCDIRRSVEKADISARSDLDGNPDEATFRGWLARGLRKSSRNRYTVPQEGEIDRAQRPDLRIEAVGAGVVPIEVKWADDWTGPQLFERLENQLVGQYLRAHDARYGVFLIGYKGNKRKWEYPTEGRRMQFCELIESLQARADDIVRGRTDVHDVAVVGIDFS